MAQLAEGSYRFAAEPKVVKPGGNAKYREPEYQVSSSNIMYDKRVIRGNTYAAMVVPQSQQQELERQQERAKKQQQRRHISQQQQQMSQSQQQASTPDPIQGKRNEEAQTEQFLEELTDRPIEHESQIQADFYIDRPPSPVFIPIKKGDDVETQIYEGELFDFDREVIPILEVIVGKTLEQARMEVIEEDELEAMRKHQREFQQIRDAELAEVQRLEAQEKRKKEESDRRKLQQRARIEQQQTAHQKFVCRIFSKRYLSNIQQEGFRFLGDSGFFRNPLQVALYDQFIPWLLEESLNLNTMINYSEKIIEQVDQKNVKIANNEHSRAILREFGRREDIRQKEIKAQKEKEQRKRKREQDRIAFRRKLYIENLKEQIQNEIINVGETKERILDQIYTDGDYRITEKIVGTPGGLFGEFLCLITVMEEIYQEDWKFEALVQFIQTYVIDYMKQDIFEFTNVNSNEINSWLENLKIPQEEAEDLLINLDNLHQLPDPLWMPFMELVMDPNRNIPNTALTIIFQNAERFGIRLDLIRAVIMAYYRLMGAKDSAEGQVNQVRNKIRLTDLPGMEQQDIKPQAVARIRIPIIRPGQEKEDQSEEEELKETSKDKKQVQPEIQQITEEEVEHEAEILDQVLMIQPRAPSGLAVFVSHQAAQRFLRRELAYFALSYIQKNDPDKEEYFEEESVFKKLDEKMEQWERTLWEIIDPDMPIIDFEIN